LLYDYNEKKKRIVYLIYIFIFLNILLMIDILWETHNYFTGLNTLIEIIFLILIRKYILDDDLELAKKVIIIYFFLITTLIIA